MLYKVVVVDSSVTSDDDQDNDKDKKMVQMKVKG